MTETIEKKQDQNRLGWFAIGAILGAAIAIGVVMMRGGAAPATNDAAIRAAVKQELAAIDFKSLVKQGALEAIREDQQQAGIAPEQPAPVGPIQGPAAFIPAQQPQAGGQVPLGNNILGESSAKVTVIEYSDFQ